MISDSNPHSTALLGEVDWFDRASRAPKLRTMREWAESVVVIPEGRYAGMKYRVKRQPYAKEWFRVVHSDYFRIFAFTGNVQSGKSLHGFVFPVIYHATEIIEPVIIGGPTMDVLRAKWFKELRPVFVASPDLAWLLPTRGPGSEGGFAEEIFLNNGVSLRFMTGHLGERKIMSDTARVVCVTEIDKIDVASELSREADPIKQFTARTESYGDDAVAYFECTVSVQQGRIWQEYIQGSEGQLLCPCAHCGVFVLPEREHFKGWQGATNQIDAEKAARFHCPECGKPYDDEQRRRMVERCRLVHRGQTIDKLGRVTGELPKTRTLGFRASAFHNIMAWSSAHIAINEWKCDQSRENFAMDAEDHERRQCQFVWVRPFESEDFSDFKLDPVIVRRRVDEWTNGVLPPDTDFTVVGIDPGKFTCWWVAIAFRANRKLHVPAYGAFTAVSDTEQALELALLNSLREHRETLVLPGFQVSGTEVFQRPKLTVCDAGYQTKIINGFARDGGAMWNSSVMPMFGRGRSQVKFGEGMYSHPKMRDKRIRVIGEEWYLSRDYAEGVTQCVFNADYWKVWFQTRLTTEISQPGALTLYRSTKGNRFDEHGKISHHWCAEQMQRVEKPGKGIVEEFVKHGQNHWLDAAAMACVGGSICGFGLINEEHVKKSRKWFTKE